MINDEKRQRILDLIEKVKNEKSLVIVEGKKDKECLETLGLENIFVLKKGTISAAIEKIISGKIKKCVVLTDFDHEGKKLYYTIKRELVKNGVIVDDKLRKALIWEKLSHIEGLATFLS